MQAFAPKDKAIAISVPRVTPLSSIISAFPATVSAILGRAEMLDGT
jgi:hypothetical protein